MPSPSTFRKTLNNFYAKHGRHSLPWRRTRDPYKILVSEIMLQQTQVDRVIPKYKTFLKHFPTVESLAAAPTRQVLKEWQGLGYNRRAINLKRAAEVVVEEHGGKFPRSLEELLKLPGVGPATAGDLLAFAWDMPAIVIETNIRTVFIHHFFPGRERVSDREIAGVMESVIPTFVPRGGLGISGPREWYYALMDYGSYLKQTLGNNAAQSAQYKKQPKFKGSNRELRSKILKLVLEDDRTEAEVRRLLGSPVEQIRKNLLALCEEGLIKKSGRKFTS